MKPLVIAVKVNEIKIAKISKKIKRLQLCIPSGDTCQNQNS